MATILKVKRLAGNPRRRRMTAKQLRYFGTRRQRKSMVTNRRRKRNIEAYTDKYGYVHPIRGTKGYKSSRAFGDKTRKRRRNSALVVTLGAAPGLAGLNPRRRRRNKMARPRRTASGKFAPARRRRRTNRRRYDNRKRYDNPRRRRRTNRRRYDNPRRRRRNRRRYDNPRRYNRRRRSNPVRHHRRRRMSANRRRSRNPSIMGQPLTSKGALKLIGGGLLGVVGVKLIPRMIPANLIPSTSPYVTVLITGVSAVVLGWLIGKVDRELGDGATFGGLMVAGSQLVNAVAPGLSFGGVPVGGLGDLMPGQFVVPQNPLRLPPPPPQPAGHPAAGAPRVTVSGLARAYGPAF